MRRSGVQFLSPAPVFKGFPDYRKPFFISMAQSRRTSGAHIITPVLRSHEFKQWPDILIIGCAKSAHVFFPCLAWVNQINLAPAITRAPQLDQEQVSGKALMASIAIWKRVDEYQPRTVHPFQ